MPMRVCVPPYRTHLALMEHDRSHGQARAKFGAHVHWLRSWLVQRRRQWTSADWLVCGANPILGALACAGLARAGQKVLWLCSEEFDAWDYPLSVAGEHDDLFRAAGLPPMGHRLFSALGALGVSNARVAWGWRSDYVFESDALAGQRLAFASRSAPSPRPLGDARLAAQGWARNGFSSSAAFAPLALPRRMGSGERQQVVQARRAVWTSDRLDGIARSQATGESSSPQEVGCDARLGRARWHAQEPLDFASQSREDIKLALRLGGWA